MSLLFPKYVAKGGGQVSIQLQDKFQPGIRFLIQGFRGQGNELGVGVNGQQAILGLGNVAVVFEMPPPVSEDTEITFELLRQTQAD